MADFLARIKPRRSSVTGETPSAADLHVSELAINTADGKLFTKHTDGSIKEISGTGGSGSIQDIEDIGNVAPRQIAAPQPDREWDVLSDLSATGGWQYSGGSLTINKESSDGTDIRTTVAATPSTGTVWVSFDDETFEEIAYTDRAIAGDTVTIDFVVDVPANASAIFLTFSDPYSSTNSLDKDMLLYDSAANVWSPKRFTISRALDVDTSSIDAGDVLEWDNNDSTFKRLTLAAVAKSGDFVDLLNKPSAAPVDSVNGDTGAVSLGVQDMNDYAKRQDHALFLPDFNNGTGTQCGLTQWKLRYRDGEPVYLFSGNTDGSTSDFVTQLQVGDSITFTRTGSRQQTFTTTIAAAPRIYSNNGPSYSVDLAEAWPSDFLLNQAGNGNQSGTIVGEGCIIESPNIPLSLLDPVEGDVLTWDDTAELFRTERPKGFEAAITALTDVDTSTTAPSNNDALLWDTSNWVPGSPLAGRSISELSDVDTTTAAPSDGQSLVWVASSSVWRPETITAGEGSAARRVSVVKTALAGSNGNAYQDHVTGIGKAGLFLSVQTDIAARVRFYTNESARNADVDRQIVRNPDRGSGCLLELITEPNVVYQITPSVNYFNMDATTTARLGLTVNNLSGAGTSVDVTVKALILQE